MFVADTDWETAPAALAAVRKRLDGVPVYAYSKDDEELFGTIIAWFKRLYGLDVPREWILTINGIVPALAQLSFLVDGPALANAPNYVGLLSAPRRAGKKLVTSQLIETVSADNTLSYDFDFDDMERVAKTEGAEIFLLNNPHNPIGKLYSKRDIEQLADFAERTKQIVISDEIHCELLLNEGKHIPWFSLAPENSVSLYSAGKICNMPAINEAFAVVPDAALRERVAAASRRLGGIGPLNLAAAKGGFSEDCDAWKLELNDYLRGNRDYLESELKRRLPKLKLPHTEGTYLQWVDFSAYDIDGDVQEYLTKHAKVYLTDGVSFAGTEKHVRINFGCPRYRITEALDRIENAVNI
jgi:cystathionine beta-lyase